MNCALMFIISNRFGRKCLSNVLQLQRCSDMFNVVSHIMAHWYELINTFIITINFCNGKKMNCALMFCTSNQFGRKCLNNSLQL